MTNAKYSIRLIYPNGKPMQMSKLTPGSYTAIVIVTEKRPRGCPSKHIGTIFEGRWKVTKRIPYGKRSAKYELTNIFNNNVVIIHAQQFFDIVNNKTSVSKILSYRTAIAKHERRRRFYR